MKNPRTVPSTPLPPGQSSARPLGEVYMTTTTAPIPYPNGTTRYEQAAADPRFAPQLAAEGLILEIGEVLTEAMAAEGIDTYELGRRADVPADNILHLLHGEDVDMRTAAACLHALGWKISVTPAKATPIVPLPGQDAIRCAICGFSMERVAMISCVRDNCPMLRSTRMGG